MSRELRPTNMAEAFMACHLNQKRKPSKLGARVLRVMERPGVGLVDNATGRRPARNTK